MTQYLILIYGDEAEYAKGTQADWDKLYADHVAFQENNQNTGRKTRSRRRRASSPTAGCAG